MCSEMESRIAMLEDRIQRAQVALEYCAMSGIDPVSKTDMARDTLAKIWPTPPKPRVIEVGGVYTPKTGSPQECVCVRGEFAYMIHTITDNCPAYVWDIYGKSLSLNSTYDIDWSRS